MDYLPKLSEINEIYQPPRLTEIARDLLRQKEREDLAQVLEMSKNSQRTDIEKISILLPHIEIPKEILNRKYD